MASATHQHPLTLPQSAESKSPLTASPRPLSNGSSSPVTVLPSLATAGLKASSPTTSLKNFPAQSFQAPILTGAGALADERRMKASNPLQQRQQVSANPANPSSTGLMRPANENGISKPGDAPPPALNVEAPGGSITPATSMVAEPMEMDETDPDSQAKHSAPLDDRSDHDRNMGDTLRPPVENEGREVERSNKALTYPPRPTIDENRSEGARGMSLPGSTSNRSNSNKKHKCPNCATEFTRHHNLKSHLLTHSQEKPFACDSCNQRFRRLHDLKRHAKLHTGERPHVCEKCKREFARGDALARHSKGPTGCAGRRGRGGDDDEDGEGDASFNGDESINGDNGDDPDVAEQGDFKRRKSEPQHSRKRSFQQAVDPNLQPPRNPSTYPPGAPPTMRPDAGHDNNQFATPNHLSPRTGGTPGQVPPHVPASGSYFASQGNVTESPRPISPGTADARRMSAQGFVPPPRARSPSLNTAFQRQHIRGSINNHAGTPPILPAPNPSSQAPPQQLPSLAGIGVDARNRQPAYPSPTSGTFPPHHQQPPPPPPNSSIPPVPPLSLHRPQGQPAIIHSQNSAHSSGTTTTTSSHPRSSGGSMREILNSEPPPPQTPSAGGGSHEHSSSHDSSGGGGGGGGGGVPAAAAAAAASDSQQAWNRQHGGTMMMDGGEKQMLREENQALREEVQALRAKMGEYEAVLEAMRGELVGVREGR